MDADELLRDLLDLEDEDEEALMLILNNFMDEFLLEDG